MTVRVPATPQQKETEIREWFGRHHRDYCSCRDCDAPPLVWSEYFAWLLSEVERLRDIPGRNDEG